MTPTLDRQALDDLKNRVDLVELFRSCGLEPKKRGKNWLCRCPFHEGDETPSLSINSPLWNCFGCAAGGDALEFLRLKENLDFPSALARLQELAGALPAAEPQPKAAKKLPGGFKRAELLNRVAEQYHRRFFETPEGREYLSGRGLNSTELWKAFQVGFCDGSLRKALPEDGALIEALQAIGVLTEEGKELFRGCVVVPLTHPEGGVVGFYGRRIRPDANNRHLYLPGPHRGVLNWQGLKSSPSVILTESVLDALSFWQAGQREASCLYGTQGLPEPLLDLLRRFEVRRVTLALDGDRAGSEAISRLSPQLQELGIFVSEARLPENADPNGLLCTQGEAGLQKLADKARPLSTAGPRPPAPATTSQTTEKGFVMELGAVTYRVELMGPFSGRLRASVNAFHTGGAWTQDRIDLYLHRDRLKLSRHLMTQLGLSRLDAESQLAQIYAKAEEWVKGFQRQNAAESKEIAPEPMSELERQEALVFLKQPGLLEELLKDIESLGYIGEENAKLLAYLIGVSRKLPKPLSGIILSQSGCGKSTLTDVIEQLTPPEDVLSFTRITAQALQYMAQTMLQGKLIIVEERAGAESAEYSIRILQSRQRLVQAVPQKDPATGKIATQIIVVEGPVAYLETTTDAKINHENATRCFEITLDESQEQTERIQEAQRNHRLPTTHNRLRQAEAIRKKHHQAQRLLEPVLVFVPFADQLTFPSKKLRNRRDQERFLSLIDASAFLHQHQRERGKTEDGDAYVLASLDDYRLAYRLAQRVLQVTLHELSRGAQDVWRQVCEWVNAEAGGSIRDFLFTRRDLRQLTGAEDHQLRLALQELVDMEYLEVATGATGRAFQYRLLISNEAEAPATLIAPDDLERRLQKSK